MKTKEEITRLFLRMQAIYLKKWTDCFSSTDIRDMAMETWAEGLADIDNMAIKEALLYCQKNIEWPPSIAEFRRICDKFSGVPDEDQAFNAAIRREFNHPIIKLAFGAVGSWAFTHSDEKSLRAKFKEAYDNAREEYSRDRVFYDKDLLDYNESQKTIELQPIKQPSEKISWRERKSALPFDYDQMRKERAEEGMRIYNQHQTNRPISVEPENKPNHKPSATYKGWMNEKPVRVKDYFSD